MRLGVTPIVTLVLLTAMVVSLGTGAYIFLTDQQDFIIANAKQADLETVNISCNLQQVSWWIRNDASYAVDTAVGDIFVKQNGTIDSARSRSDIRLDYDFVSGEETDQIVFTPSPPLQSGEPYTFELDYRDNVVSAYCRAGNSWYDPDWTHRHRISFSGSLQTSYIHINTQELIRNGKMQPDCDDIRITQGNTLLNHTTANCNDEQTRIRTTPTVANAATYLYYGNPNAANNEATVPSTSTQATLHQEERINFPG